MVLALYRKYRPATFAEVVGQEHVTEPLRTALSGNRINHAYLFSGPRGCGKTTSARILARSLNCEQGPTADPCGECGSCVALAPEGSGSVDVVELDAASHGGVDDTRELRDRASFAPARARYRIFIIDEAHMVTTQGFNALLKIVEEPPEHLIFIFATTEPDKVLTTIRSRTHHYPFRLLPPGVMRELMERICADESVVVEPAVYPLVIQAGGGSARDTLSVLDQLLAGADDRGIAYERAVALLGVTDAALIHDMLDALAADDSAAVYATVDRVVEAGHDPRRFASDMLDRLRDVILLRSVPDAPDRGLVQVSGDELTKMRQQAEQLGAATLSRFADIVHNGLEEMRGATAPRLLLELLCARMLLPAVSDSETALLQRVERVERRMTIAPPAVDAAAGETAEEGEADEAGKRVFQRPHERAARTAADSGEAATAAVQGSTPERDGSPEQGSPHDATRQDLTQHGRAEHGVSHRGEAQREGSTADRDEGSSWPRPAQQAPDQASTPASAERPTAEAPAASTPSEGADAGASPGRDAAEIRRVWTELLRAVAERNRPTQALLLNATVQDLQGDNTLVLSMPTSGLVKQFAQQHRIDFVKDALRAVIGGEWEVRCVEAGATPPPASSAAKPSASTSAAAPQASTTSPQRQPSSATHAAAGARETDREAPAHRDSSAASGPTPGPVEGGPETPASEPEPEPPEPQHPEPPEDGVVHDSAVASEVPTASGAEQQPDESVEEDAVTMSETSAAPGASAPEDRAMDLLAKELGARKIDS